MLCYVLGVCTGVYITYKYYKSNCGSLKPTNTKGLYELIYTHKGKTYCVFIEPKRGPKPQYIVCNGNEIVTNDFIKYLGSDYIFHGKQVTPQMLGYDTITVINSITKEKSVFGPTNIICFDEKGLICDEKKFI